MYFTDLASMAGLLYAAIDFPMPGRPTPAKETAS
jgi:hypothetical protein